MQLSPELVCNLVSFQDITFISALTSISQILEFNVLLCKIFFLVLLSDRAVVLCHSEADIHRRLQHLSGGAGSRCVDVVALQVRRDDDRQTDFY